LAGQTASLGSPADPNVLVSVGGSTEEFTISIAVSVDVPVNYVVNSEGDYTLGAVTLMWGLSYPTLPTWSAGLAASANTFGGPPPPSNSTVLSFYGQPDATIWWYTIWTVDSEIAAESSYQLSITLKQLGG
jgi:hypothetical protein